MHVKWALVLGLLMSLWGIQPAGSNDSNVSFDNDVSTVIESFMERQFPEARRHFWVVNGTQWQAEHELVVDVNTVVVGQSSPSPLEHRFLLLIVKGKLAGAQNIPLDAKPDCKPEAA